MGRFAGRLTKQQCFGLLAGQHLGRVVLVDDRGPLALPVDRVVDQQSALFRTDAGTKREVANRGARVGFEVNGIDVATRTGWRVPVRAGRLLRLVVQLARGTNLGLTSPPR